MRTLTAMRTDCTAQGRRFVLVRVQPAVQRLLALSDLEPTFELVDSVVHAHGAGQRHLAIVPDVPPQACDEHLPRA